MVMEEPINARFIIEAQGKPKEFVEKSLRSHIEKMKAQPGVEIYDEKYGPPVTTKEGLFSGLADVGIKVKNFETISAMVLAYGPSAVVILGPEKIEITSREVQNTMNDIATILHTFAQANLDLKVKSYISEQLLAKVAVQLQEEQQRGEQQRGEQRGGQVAAGKGKLPGKKVSVKKVPVKKVSGKKVSGKKGKK